MRYGNVAELVGQTMVDVSRGVNEYGADEIVFTTDSGRKYELRHGQDCCESVTIESITGDLQDLVGEPILLAEEAASAANPEGVVIDYQESFTWTFYKFATRKGYVDVRWYGESNGYYSERVDFYEVSA